MGVLICLTISHFNNAIEFTVRNHQVKAILQTLNPHGLVNVVRGCISGAWQLYGFTAYKQVARVSMAGKLLRLNCKYENRW